MPQSFTAVPSSTATPSQTEMKSKCSTVTTSPILKKMSGILLKSGTQEKETGRKCILSKSENLKHQVEQTSSISLSSNSQKTAVKKHKISSKILEMRKRWEGNHFDSVKNNVSRSEQTTKPICDGPMRMEIENDKLCRPTALGEGERIRK